MIKHLDRLAGRLYRRLFPGFIHGADHWMLLHWPFLWRSRLFPLACQALIAAAVCLGIGLAVDMNPTNAWVRTQVGTATAWLHIFGLIAAVYWWWATARYAISGIHWRIFL